MFNLLPAVVLTALPLVGYAANGKLTSADVAVVPVQIGAKASWKAPRCLPITAPPWSVFVATTGAATITVQRYLDAACTWPAGVTQPLTPLPLVKSVDCPAGTYCGDQAGSPDQSVAAIRVTVTDTSNAPNWITIAKVFSDPPEPIQSQQPVYDPVTSR